MIEIDKHEFIEGEPIYVVVTLNNSSSQMHDCSRFYLEGRALDLMVTEFDGKILPYNGNIFSYSSGVPQIEPIQPNTSIQYICDLQRFYYNFRELKAAFPLPVVARLVPGSYTLSARYSNEGKLISSNILTFTVVTPQGIDAALFEVLKIKFQAEYVAGKNREEKVTFFKELEMKNKKSKYHPLICQYLAAYLSDKGDSLEANEVRKSIIKTYPNTGHAMKVYKWLKLSDKEMVDFYNELKLSSPNSRVVRYVENRQTQ